MGIMKNGLIDIAEPSTELEKWEQDLLAGARYLHKKEDQTRFRQLIRIGSFISIQKGSTKRGWTKA